MVPIVEGGVAEFNALAYAMPNQRTVEYLETRLMEKMASFGEHLTEWGRSFMQQSVQALDAFHGSDAIRMANAAIRKAGTYFDSNTVRPLLTLDALQTAPPVMQPYLMANPFIRGLFHDGRIDGYSHSYVDTQPGVIGPGHHHYNLITDSVLMPDDENDFKVSYHFTDPENGESVPTHEQKHDVVFSAWDLLEGYARFTRRDGTSVFDTQD